MNRAATRIVYISNVGSYYKIFVMNFDGSSKVQLTTGNYHDTRPHWSPDGSKIVFESEKDGQAEIYIMNADGTNQTRLTSNAEYDGMPSWSPDGTRVAFVSRRTGGYRVYTMKTNGTDLVQISSQAYSAYPVWSWGGQWIAYSTDQDGDGWMELWWMEANGENQEELGRWGFQLHP